LKFKTLTIENFLAIAEGKVELADRGLVLIQGVNNDDTSAASNGAGKSSLADSLCWCLYGETARGVSGDDVINDTAGKNTRVEVVIEDDGNIYTIARHRKHKPNKNALTVFHQGATLGSAPKDLTKGTDKLTQVVVDKIIGASLEVFRSAVYAGQEQMPDLPAMTDKSLKLLIEEASGVTLLESAYTEARERLGVVTGNVERVKQETERLEHSAKHHRDNVAEFERIRDEWDTAQKKRAEDEKDIARTKVSDVKVIDAELARDPNAEADYEAAIAVIDNKIDSVDYQNTELAEHETLVAQASAKMLALDRQVKLAADATRKHKTAYEQINHKIGCPCDGCGREITAEEISAASDAAKRDLTTKATEYRSLKSELEAAQKETEKRCDERDAFKASMTDLSTVTRDRAHLQAKLDEVRRKVQARNTLADAARTHVNRSKAIMAEENPHLANIERHRKLLEKAEKDLAGLKSTAEQLETDHAHASAVAKVFSPAGVRAHILDQVTPFLNDRTAHYLATLSDGNITATWTTLVLNAKSELREKFSIEVVNEKGSQKFAGLSGGEKRKVRVATALALQDLVATRAAKPIELFIGDEIDHALDEPGLERLTTILEEKAQERGSVFVISHNSLSDWIPQIIEVEKKNGQTTLREVTA
jgi:DNA repair exonuclease SbcCD ATPase subunit